MVLNFYMGLQGYIEVDLNITILGVGKVKEGFFRDAISEYGKRLGRYCKFQVIEVADEMTPDGASSAVVENILEKEGSRILSKIADSDYVISLEINGKKLSSEGLSKLMGDLALDGKSSLVFVIGGSLGLHSSVTKRANYHLSFSDMTFPHQLMRVILAEQIYRGFRILHNEPYHKQIIGQ